ncbi:hypothetical protein QF13_000172 [Salmonella enterica subsp. enterica]|nr:hypothetical protein [Salmonella enterica subsp. enterica]EIP0099766.1 hypothetical protein [Salmonella enterica subsp. enterica serovar Wangata]
MSVLACLQSVLACNQYQNINNRRNQGEQRKTDEFTQGDRAAGHARRHH